MAPRRALVAVSLLAALSQACDRALPPWERTAMQAVVTLRGEGLDLRGRVTFVRPQSKDIGTVQFDVERDGHLDNATLLASGKTAAFSDGLPRPILATEERALAVLAALFAWPGREAERRRLGDGAVVRLADGAEYTLGIVQESSGDPHHKKR